MQPTMDAIEDIYADLDVDVTEEEFREAVTEKVEQMGGLADEETAAMLVAHELTDREVSGIADVEPGMEEVAFLAKVVSIGERREFERDDGEDGRVVNVEVADETGSIRAAFWDEMADAAVDELEVGQVLRLKGRPRDGYNGVEVSVDRAEPDEDAEIDVELKDAYAVEELSLGRSDVTLRGRVLDAESVRTFQRDDGSEGRVANLVLGDETGRVRVTLWDEKADRVEAFEPGESVEVIDGYVREREGDLELHVGNRGVIEPIDEDVRYVPEATDIADVEIDQTVDIAGVVRSADPKRTFDRDDGSEGQVRNIRVQDATGDIRVALWGDKADREIGPGDELQLADVEIQEGWQDDLEASAGWRSTVTVLDEGTASLGGSPDRDGASATDPSATDASETEDAGLSAFESGDGSGSDTESKSVPESDPGDPGPRPGDDASTGGKETDDESGPVEFTGVVVQVGDPVVLDDGEETVTVDTDEDLQLGQEVTVRGRRDGGRVDPDEIG